MNEQPVGKSPEPDEHAETVVLRNARQLPPPVFVDPSGARRRRVRWIVYTVGVVILAALLALWLTQFLGAAEPPAVDHAAAWR
ncbi:hypothetical protein [Dactylosporangium salmoneum]|uniref:hypothetical protein n=1 Tax=Dactylosporangium salmoneum TaxID=53361 RepID=UPI0031D29E25